MDTASLERRYRARQHGGWRSRLRRALEPPAPFVMNPREPKDFPLGRWNLYIGGAGRRVEGYVNLDLFPMPGVDVAADAEALPFPSGVFTRISESVVRASPEELRRNPRSSPAKLRWAVRAH